MANSNLPAGAFFTQINGKRCTAIPKNGGGGNNSNNTSRGGNNNNKGENGRNQQSKTTAPPARSTEPPPQETSSTTTTTSSPPPSPPPPPPQVQTPPPVQSTSSTPPPPAQATPPPQIQQPPPAALAPAVSTTPTRSSPPPPSPPAAAPTPPAVAPAPEPPAQNGGTAGTSSAAGAENQGGVAAQNPPQAPPQASQPALLPSASTSVARFSVIPEEASPSPPTQPAASAVTSPADNKASTAPPAQTPAAELAGPAGASPSSSPSPSPPPAGTPPPAAGGLPQITAIGTANPSSVAPAGGDRPVSSSIPQVSATSQGGDGGGMSGMTIAVAGGVAGGVLLISLMAFLIWFLRKRKLRKRHSTLLTPLSVGPENPRFPPEKDSAYIINRGSIGPTPRTERIKASLGYGFRKLKDRVDSIVSRRGNGGSSGGVNMNRGNSQFIEAGNTTPGSSRSASAASGREKGGGFFAGISGWRKGRDTNRNSDDPFGGAREKKAEMTPPNNSSAQPDFLTLLGMDDRELQREAQRKRASRNGSASSGDHFLGSLGLNFANSEDPFSDSNSLAHQSARPAPLMTPGKQQQAPAGGNPFSDANAIAGPPAPKPSTYVSDVRRSRGPSISAGTALPTANSIRGPDSYYNRDSVNSVESFATRRNKFRSDPFDLERPELLGKLASTAGPPPSNPLVTNSSASIKKPGPAHQRADSLSSSKYTSGVSSMGDWSDPGPDVGPAASRSASAASYRSESPTGDNNPRRSSSSGSNSVGKAL